MKKEKKKDLFEIIALVIIAIALFVGLFTSVVHLTSGQDKLKRQNITNQIDKSASHQHTIEGDNNNSSNNNINNNNIDNNNNNNDNNNNNNNNTSIDNNSTVSSDFKDDSTTNNSASTNINTNSNINENNSISSDISTVDNIPSSNITNDVKYSQDEVISYFNDLELQMLNNEEDVFLREKTKNIFTTVVDFLFYDSAIKGYTFSGLTTSAKLKIISIALKIDNKVDNYFPNYKQTIKGKMQDFKGRAALLYLEFTSNLCNSVGSSACDEARDDFKKMKESFNLSWSIIKDVANTSYDSLTRILDEWYQSIK